MLWITKYSSALLYSTKRKIVMTIFHRLQGSLVVYFFTFLFRLAKFYIYTYDTRISYIINCHTNLAYVMSQN